MSVETPTKPLPDLDERVEQLEERVEQVVQSRTSGRIRGLRVQIADGRLIITGRTSTYYNKQLATHAALDVASAGCAVQNEVEVC
jgi:hypothetical protein